MRHQVDGRKFGRNTSHRKAMFRNMANSVIVHEQIETTVQKAKEIRRVVDRLVTLGKSGSPASRRLAFDRTRDNEVVKKLFTLLADRYKARAGGYTRVLKVSDRRWGDGAEMALVELVDHPEIDRKRKPKVAGAAGADGVTADTQVKDPLKGFRKLFSPKQAKDASGAKAKGASKGSAARKSTAGGGSSKKGGSGGT